MKITISELMAYYESESLPQKHMSKIRETISSLQLTDLSSPSVWKQISHVLNSDDMLSLNPVQLVKCQLVSTFCKMVTQENCDIYRVHFTIRDFYNSVANDFEFSDEGYCYGISECDFHSTREYNDAVLDQIFDLFRKLNTRNKVTVIEKLELLNYK